MINKNIFTLFISITFVFVNSLAGTYQNKIKSNYVNKNASELLINGENYLYQQQWSKGRELLQYIEEYLPSSPESSTAHLVLTDSFFFDPHPSYPEALMHYQNYLTFFPETPKKDYVLFHIGLCLYASINKVERNQSETIKAIEAFEDLIKEVPNSIYIADAKTKIDICKRQLAETSLRVGIAYVRGFNYEPGAKRISYTIDTYKDYVDGKRAYFFLAEAIYKGCLKDYKHKKAKITNQVAVLDEANANLQPEDQYTKCIAEAKAYYNKVRENYPTNVWAKRANNRLIEIDSTSYPK